MKTKKCNKCGEIKDISEFYRRKDIKDGYRYQCKECSCKQVKRYRKSNPEKVKSWIKINNTKWRLNNPEYYKQWRKNNVKSIKQYSKQYHKDNIEKHKKYCIDNAEHIKKCHKKWYKNNPKKVKESRKKYLENNYNRIIARSKEWYKNNPERAKKNCMNWRKNNSERIKERTKEYRKIPKNKLNHGISVSIRKSLKGNKNGKHWENLVNYNLQDLKKHLENLFADSMNWKRFLKGEIHIDHIIPTSLWEFKSYNDREFKQCWALCNLQPLWASENISKGAKV